MTDKAFDLLLEKFSDSKLSDSESDSEFDRDFTLIDPRLSSLKEPANITLAFSGLKAINTASITRCSTADHSELMSDITKAIKQRDVQRVHLLLQGAAQQFDNDPKEEATTIHIFNQSTFQNLLLQTHALFREHFQHSTKNHNLHHPTLDILCVLLAHYFPLYESQIAQYALNGVLKTIDFTPNKAPNSRADAQFVIAMISALIVIYHVPIENLFAFAIFEKVRPERQTNSKKNKVKKTITIHIENQKIKLNRTTIESTLNGLNENQKLEALRQIISEFESFIDLNNALSIESQKFVLDEILKVYSKTHSLPSYVLEQALTKHFLNLDISKHNVTISRSLLPLINVLFRGIDVDRFELQEELNKAGLNLQLKASSHVKNEFEEIINQMICFEESSGSQILTQKRVLIWREALVDVFKDLNKSEGIDPNETRDRHQELPTAHPLSDASLAELNNSHSSPSTETPITCSADDLTNGFKELSDLCAEKTEPLNINACKKEQTNFEKLWMTYGHQFSVQQVRTLVGKLINSNLLFQAKHKQRFLDILIRSKLNSLDAEFFKNMYLGHFPLDQTPIAKMMIKFIRKKLLHATRLASELSQSFSEKNAPVVPYTRLEKELSTFATMDLMQSLIDIFNNRPNSDALLNQLRATHNQLVMNLTHIATVESAFGIPLSANHQKSTKFMQFISQHFINGQRLPQLHNWLTDINAGKPTALSEKYFWASTATSQLLRFANKATFINLGSRLEFMLNTILSTRSAHVENFSSGDYLKSLPSETMFTQIYEDYLIEVLQESPPEIMRYLMHQESLSEPESRRAAIEENRDALKKAIIKDAFNTRTSIYPISDDELVQWQNELKNTCTTELLNTQDNKQLKGHPTQTIDRLTVEQLQSTINKIIPASRDEMANGSTTKEQLDHIINAIFEKIEPKLITNRLTESSTNNWRAQIFSECFILSTQDQHDLRTLLKEFTHRLDEIGMHSTLHVLLPKYEIYLDPEDWLALIIHSIKFILEDNLNSNQPKSQAQSTQLKATAEFLEYLIERSTLEQLCFLEERFTFSKLKPSVFQHIFKRAEIKSGIAFAYTEKYLSGLTPDDAIFLSSLQLAQTEELKGKMKLLNRWVASRSPSDAKVHVRSPDTSAQKPSKA